MNISNNHDKKIKILISKFLVICFVIFFFVNSSVYNLLAFNDAENSVTIKNTEFVEKIGDMSIYKTEMLVNWETDNYSSNVQKSIAMPSKCTVYFDLRANGGGTQYFKIMGTVTGVYSNGSFGPQVISHQVVV